MARVVGLRGLMFAVLAGSALAFASSAGACSPPIRRGPPPTYAERLAESQNWRARSDHIVLTKVVEVEVVRGRRDLFLQSLLLLGENSGPTGGTLEYVGVPSDCGPYWKVGDYVLVYYRAVMVREEGRPSSRPWTEVRPWVRVATTDNIDPAIAPMLMAASQKERERASELRARRQQRR